MSTTRSDTTRPDTLTHAVIAFLASLVLVLPTYGALGVTSDAGLWGWFAGGIGGIVVVGALLRLLVAEAPALLLLATAGYLVVAPAALFVVAAAGDPPGNGSLALLVGVPAAALGALGATAVVGRVREALAPAAAAVLLTGLVGIGVAPTAGEALADARDEAEQVARLEASGLSPYLPEIGDLRASRSSYSVQDDRIVGYGYSYRDGTDRGAVDAPYLSVDVLQELPAYRDCDTTERAIYDCREGEGYYVLSDDGSEEYVVADHGGTKLLAWYVDGVGELPDPDEVGRALAGAELVEWSDVVDPE